MLATPDLIQETTQWQRVAEMLPRCLSEVPLYQQRLREDGLGSGSVAELFRRLPLITKLDIRQGFPQNFLGAREDLDDLVQRDLVELEHTSGTSEGRTPLILPRGWWAEQEGRALRLNPLVASVLEEWPSARRVTINSPMCSNDVCYQGVPSHEDRIVGDTLFVSLSRYPFLWSQSELNRIAEETLDWQPQFLDVDPVYGVIFALHCQRQGIRIPSLRFILTSYEYASVVHRRILQRAFNVPVFDLYGSTETGHLLMETEGGLYRPALETAWLELMESGADGISELVVTTLTNPYMPLIRYRINDLVEPCPQSFGARYRLHGRVVDSFHRPQVGRITTRQIDQCFLEAEGFAHYQLSEAAQGPWQLRFVPNGNGPSPETVRRVQDKLEALLHLEEGVRLEPTDLLVPEASGKFRLGVPRKPPTLSPR
jgi:phenylacetate-CoA ligase